MARTQSDRRNAPRRDDPLLRGRRFQPRATIVLSASIEALSGVKSARLLDVSLTGARLEGRELPVVGKEVIAICGAVEAFGTIVWAGSGRCGIQFDQPISVQELLTLRDLSLAAEPCASSPKEL